jgi:hypothetical protein
MDDLAGRGQSAACLEDVLAAYLEACDAGRAPGRTALVDRHPHLAADLNQFFANHDRLVPLLGRLRNGLFPAEPRAGPCSALIRPGSPEAIRKTSEVSEDFGSLGLSG